MNVLGFLRNWRADLSGLEQALLAVSIIGGSLVVAVPPAARPWLGGVVAGCAAAAAGIDRFLSLSR